MGSALDVDVTTLSGGQIKRVALARALVAVGGEGGQADDGDLLILDEPTNHMDLDGIAWLEDWLARFTGCHVLVTYDPHDLAPVPTQLLQIAPGHAHSQSACYPTGLA